MEKLVYVLVSDSFIAGRRTYTHIHSVYSNKSLAEKELIKHKPSKENINSGNFEGYRIEIKNLI